MLIRKQPQSPQATRSGRFHRPQIQGFTLVEMMAVAVVIAVLMGLLIGISHYVNLRCNILRTKSEMAALGTAIEMFRADYGRYPTSSLVRFDGTNAGYIFAQVTNAALLYTQLTGIDCLTGAKIGKQYFRATPKMWTNVYVWVVGYSGGASNFNNMISYFIDPWGKPYDYYRTYPTTTAQVNQATFDLISAGPDRRFNSSDDIVNWKVLQ